MLGDNYYYIYGTFELNSHDGQCALIPDYLRTLYGNANMIIRTDRTTCTCTTCKCMCSVPDDQD